MAQISLLTCVSHDPISSFIANHYWHQSRGKENILSRDHQANEVLQDKDCKFHIIIIFDKINRYIDIWKNLLLLLMNKKTRENLYLMKTS